ncbi:MAG TPA: ABC transporter ATP-binding protein [Anaerolinea sp.]|nr:ABC transporter ATP-binding protein [Anaerolinea sp.]
MSANTAVHANRTLPTWRVIWSIIRFRPWYFIIDLVSVILVRVSGQLVPGLLLKAFFDLISGSAPVSLGLWGILALFVAVYAGRMTGGYGFYYADVPLFSEAALLLRRNLLKHILRRPGAAPLPDSPGEAVSRFRNDVTEIPLFVLWFNDILTGLGLIAVAIVLMAKISVWVTLIALAPLVVVGIIANAASQRIGEYRRASRAATGKVTGFIGEFFGAVQAVKVATAEESVIDHFHALNDERRRLSLRERLFDEILESLWRNMGSLGTGVVLLLAGQGMRAGTFTIGDFSLFAYLLTSMGDLTTFAGMIAARYKQLGVSVERMHRLMEGAPYEALIQLSPVDLEGPLPRVVYPARRPEDVLETLEVSGLTYTFPGTQAGIQDVNFSLRRGSLTVITGRVGSGKTTLLRVLLGLLPRQDGSVRWNGRSVSAQHAGAFFTPPRSAYTPQVPRLFSNTLRENILLGLVKSDKDIMAAARLAVLENDIQGIEHGLDAGVGPRGGRPRSAGRRARGTSRSASSADASRP